MTETPERSEQGIELDRVDQFPEIDDSPQPFWLLAVQFFVLPMIIALLAVLVYMGARALTSTEKGIPELLTDIEEGGRNKRWQAAFDLSGRLKELSGKIDPADRNRIILLFDKQISKPPAPGGVNEHDRKLARYLARCLAFLADPASAESLKVALSKKDPQLRLTCIVALGHLQKPQHIPAIADVLLAPDPEVEVRVVAAYTLGSLARVDAPKQMIGPAWVELVRRARDALHHSMQSDGSRQVQWNAGVALAATGDRRAVPMLRKLLDVEYVTGVQIMRRDEGSGKMREASKVLADERASAIENAARAAGKLGDKSLIPELKKLISSKNKKIRLAATESLAKLEQK